MKTEIRAFVSLFPRALLLQRFQGYAPLFHSHTYFYRDFRALPLHPIDKLLPQEALCVLCGSLCSLCSQYPLPQEAIRANPCKSVDKKNHFRRKPSAISVILRALLAPKPTSEGSQQKTQPVRRGGNNKHLSRKPSVCSVVHCALCAPNPLPQEAIIDHR
jgi:hypothetical protein